MISNPIDDEKYLIFKALVRMIDTNSGTGFHNNDQGLLAINVGSEVIARGHVSLRRIPSLAFDTHAAVKRLQNAGVDERLAEAVVATLGTAVRGHVATKTDIAVVKADLTA